MDAKESTTPVETVELELPPRVETWLRGQMSPGELLEDVAVRVMEKAIMPLISRDYGEESDCQNLAVYPVKSIKN